METRSFTGKKRIFILLLTFITVLVFVGVLMQSKMQTLVRGYVEAQVTRQAQVLAKVLEEEVDAQLKSLENIAVYIQAQTADMEELLEVACLEEPDAKWGVLELGGNVICGEQIETEEFSNIQDSFRGNNAVSYKEGMGVLFTVPVFHGNNIKYVLFKFYEDEQLLERFGRTCYDGEGRVLVATGDEQIMVPYIDWSDADNAFFASENVQRVFWEIRERMNIASAASVHYEEKQNSQYLFVSEVGEYDLLLVGTVASEVAEEGISYIITLVLWVFGLLLLLLAIGMAFLFGAEEKARESDELRREKMVADSANQAKSDFLANMSHEIRTPINAVVGMNEMILRECKDEEIREYAVNIQSASKTLLSLVNDILDISKIEAGKMELVEDKYTLSSVLNDVANMIQIRANQKELAFGVEVDETLPDELYGDEVRIRQIIVNLLSNAVKYTKKGSVSLHVEKEEMTPSGVTLKISVKDTGIGIRTEDMDKLFGDFERLDLKDNRNIEGTGLGLAITSKMLKLMNGYLKVDSVYGVGSTFVVYLPQKVIGQKLVGDFEANFREYMQSLEEYHESFTAPEAQILVVDDNEMNLFVVKSFLKKTEVKIECCDSGGKSIELAKQKHFDVILMDHMMPGMDGIEAMKRIRSQEDSLCKATPIIILTANAILGVREMYLAEGFDDYLSKPVDAKKLEMILRKYLPEEKLCSEEIYLPEEELCSEEISDSGAQNQPSEISGLIDVSLGLMYSANSKEMYHEFLKMFCDMKEEKLQTLEEYFEKEDWANYTVKAHALKSTSLSVGGQKLSEMAKALEMAGKGNDIAYIREHHKETMVFFEKTVKEGYSVLANL